MSGSKSCMACQCQRVCKVRKYFLVEGDELISTIRENKDDYSSIRAGIDWALAEHCKFYVESLI